MRRPEKLNSVVIAGQSTAGVSRRRFLAGSLAFVAVLAMACAFAAISRAGQARFRQSSQEYQARRARLRASIDAPVVIFGYTGHEDISEFAVFFQETYFYYLTGHDEPGAALIVFPDANKERAGGSATANTAPREVLYLPPHNLEEEHWEGPKLGPADPGIAQKTGVESVESYAKLHADLIRIAADYPHIYTLLPPPDEDGYPHLANSVAFIHAAAPHAKLKDATALLDAMRQVKSPGELELLQKAIDASIDAHFDAMRNMRPGLFEYQVAARMKEIHEMAGCEREAYAPIVGAGFNSTVLHYSALQNQIKDGDIVVLDVGGEYGGYAADITRTLPANGKFTPRQREIYEIVLGAQNAALDAVKPGVRMYEGHDSLQQVVINYFHTHGRDNQGRTLERYYIHGVSHYLGLDVHDPGNRNSPLEPGMVITVEPGLYIPEENIGVRIEDDVLVTPNGYRLLTARLPRNVDEIEKIMDGAKAGAHAQNQP
jgi:Xaa-Pro aminopeptidase